MVRYLDLSDDVDATIARYVITNPPNDFKMHPTDKANTIISIEVIIKIKSALQLLDYVLFSGFCVHTILCLKHKTDELLCERSALR